MCDATSPYFSRGRAVMSEPGAVRQWFNEMACEGEDKGEWYVPASEAALFADQHDAEDARRDAEVAERRDPHAMQRLVALVELARDRGAALQQAREALKKAHVHQCSMLCPSIMRTDKLVEEGWPHSPECEATAAALAAIDALGVRS